MCNRAAAMAAEDKIGVVAVGFEPDYLGGIDENVACAGVEAEFRMPEGMEEVVHLPADVGLRFFIDDPVNTVPEFRGAHRLNQEIEGGMADGFDGVFVISSDENDFGINFFFTNGSNHTESIGDWHFDVEENNVGFQTEDSCQSFSRVGKSTGKMNRGNIFQQVA